MKKITMIIIIALSVLLVGLYTITSTYSVIVNVIEQEGINKIVNKITIKDIFTNNDGSFNDIYYTVKKELELTEEETDLLINSETLNEKLTVVLESIVEYNVNDNIEAKLSDDEIYNLIKDGILNAENISDDLKSRVINKSKIYIKDISDYIYDIEVSVLGSNIWLSTSFIF